MSHSAKKYGLLAAGALAACSGMTEHNDDYVDAPLIFWNSDSTSPHAADQRQNLDALTNNLGDFSLDLENFARWKWADSVALLVDSRPAPPSGATPLVPGPCESWSSPGQCILQGTSLRLAVNAQLGGQLCPNARFRTEFVPSKVLGQDAEGNGVLMTRGDCTAFLVGDDLLLTAGHCVKPNSATDFPNTPQCQNVDFVFGHNSFGSRSKSRRTDVYHCMEVVEYYFSGAPGEDEFALVRTDRPVVGRHRLRLAEYGETDAVQAGDPLTMIGHSAGLPAKVLRWGDASGPVLLPAVAESAPQSDCAPCSELGRCDGGGLSSCIFTTKHDSTFGNSGSPLIGDDGYVYGIDSVANPSLGDFVFIQEDGCYEWSEIDRNTGVIGSVSTHLVPPESVPPLPPSQLRVQADFDGDNVVDALSVAPGPGSNPNFMITVTGSTPYTLDTGFAVADLPPVFDVSWNISVRDFDRDGDEDIVSHFAGFEPVYLVYDEDLSTFRPNTFSPFGSLNLDRFTIADFNGDGYADLAAQNPLVDPPTIERFYGSNTGLTRTVAIPERCDLVVGGDLVESARALAILGGLASELPYLAMYNCPGVSDNRVEFVDLTTHGIYDQVDLDFGADWVAFDYRPDTEDVVALADGGDTADVHLITSPLTGNVEIGFSIPLETGEEPAGIAWDNLFQRVLVLTDPDGDGPQRVRSFDLDSGDEDPLSAYEVTQCTRDALGTPNRTPFVSGIVSGEFGVSTVSCREVRPSERTHPTTLFDVSETVNERLGTYVLGAALSDLACDPVVPFVLWGIDAGARRIFAKGMDPLGNTCARIDLGLSILPGPWDLNGVPVPAPDGVLSVLQPGYSPFVSQPLDLAAQPQIGTLIAMDVFVPDDPAYQAWAGDVQLYLSVPSQNNWQDFVPLTGLPRGDWQTVQFQLNESARAALEAGVGVARLTLAVNRPAAQEPVLLRNLRFDGELESRSPSCTDGRQNGYETDIDCGGGQCGPCAPGKRCLDDADCTVGECVNPNDTDDEEQIQDAAEARCAMPDSSSCNEFTAVDLGADGNNVTVPNDGCVRVRDAYPVWWNTRTMQLQNTAPASYPVPFTWYNTCSGGEGSGLMYTDDWQNQFLSPTSDECATVIDLQGAGDGNMTLRYFGP